MAFGEPEADHAGWVWDPRLARWSRAVALAEPLALKRPLRAATLNVLYDKGDDDKLHFAIRYSAICAQLAALDADVIGLNEVTPRLLARLLQEAWVRELYTVSAVLDDPCCANLSAVLGGAAHGNVLLSKIRPAAVKYFMPSSGRRKEFHAMSFNLCRSHGAPSFRAALVSIHLPALPWVHEHKRRAELAGLTAELATTTQGLDACIIMGDFNFHREAENASIPSGWAEMPAVVALGPTWDLHSNKLITKMLPAWNIYNGFRTGWGWPQRMRLDRVLVHGAAGHLDWGRASAQLFAKDLIHKNQRAFGDGGLTEPWQAYLFPSDHFGVLVDIPLADDPSTKRTPPSAPPAPSAMWLYAGRRGGVAMKLLAVFAVLAAGLFHIAFRRTTFNEQ